MKKGLVGISIFFIILIIGLGVYLKSPKDIQHPLLDNVIELHVNKGDTLNSILDYLNSKGKLKSENAVKSYIEKNKLSTKIAAGIYAFPKDMTIEQILHKLNVGDVDFVKVTIPEGFNIDEIAARLDKDGIIKKDDFITACKQYELRNYMKADGNRRYALEGYLFPDTYELKKGMKGKDIIETMVDRFEQVITEIGKENNAAVDYNELDKVIIMASVIEREAEVPAERPIIASVFYNRLKKGMKLESCATVLYADGSYGLKPGEKYISIAATKFNSPYNTYEVNGLPVGPICSPGKDCIIAALKPSETNYFYFVSKDDGTHTHAFSQTYAGQIQAQKKYQGK